MSDVAIRVENLGKRYEIGELVTMRDLPRVVKSLASAPFRRLMGQSNGILRHEENPEKFYWALRDVSFEVKHGEVLGVIGRNGAGKSTLLKVLSRVTSPTEGRIDIFGRIGALLEVGTGFHPELTGRENVFLNGAILGMSKKEIMGQFDEIVEFSGVGNYIDTPVKRYSSGMRVRLGFAVAAHLEPEILIIDEVLAVGDAAFQKRCIGKIQDVAKGGRTIFFVSHKMESIAALSDRVALLRDGRMARLGDPHGIIEEHIKENLGLGDDENPVTEFEPDPNKAALIERLAVFNAAGEPVSHFDLCEPITVRMDMVVREHFESLIMAVQVRTVTDEVLFVTTEADHRNYVSDTISTQFPKSPGRYTASIVLPSPFLNAGRYQITGVLISPQDKNPDFVRGCTIHVTEVYTFANCLVNRTRNGRFAIPLAWTVERELKEALVS